MAAELIGAKLIAPYFGTSLYVWAAVLAVTLGGLAGGYFCGGFLSRRFPGTNLLAWVLLLAGAFLFLMPLSGSWILGKAVFLDVKTGSLFSLLVYLFPPLFFFGMTSPVIINLINKTLDASGESAGTVYAISTVGGILMTLATGFYILPVLGISGPMMVIGGGVMAMALSYFAVKRRFLPLIAAGIFFLASAPADQASRTHEIIHEQQGILGNIKVVDYTNPDWFQWEHTRELLVNNTCQTILNLEHPDLSYWDYVPILMNTVRDYPEGSDVLLLGLGGGTLVRAFKGSGFNVEAVELDERLAQVAVEYFGVPSSTPVHIDDARHFIRINDKRYDLVILDLFLSETPPVHLFSVESFGEIEKSLKPGGLMVVNFFGYWTGKLGRPARSIYKTLLESGFHVEIRATPGDEDHRNLLFLAGRQGTDFTAMVFGAPLEPSEAELRDAIVLEDDVPVLETLYLDAALRWREIQNELYARRFTHRLQEEKGRPKAPL